MKLNIYLDQKPDSEGRELLFFFISGKGKRAKTTTEIRIHPESWDKPNIVKSEYENYYKQKDALLQAKISVIKNLIAQDMSMMTDKNPEDIKQEYLDKIAETKNLHIKIEDRKKTAPISFHDQAKQYQAEYKYIKEPSTLRAMNQVVNHLQDYKKDVSLAEMDMNFLVGYSNFLIEKGIENVTIISRHFKDIKGMVTYGLDKPEFNLPTSIAKIPELIKKIKLKSISKIPYAPKWEQIEKIAGLDVMNKKQLHIRDWFIISCHTGLRNSDLENVEVKMLSQQRGHTMLRVFMKKTGLDYQIPISKTVEEILNRYPDLKIPSYTNQEHNREIKKIVRPVLKKGIVKKISFSGNTRKIEEIPAYNRVSTHTGRRVFGRRFLDMKGSPYILMQIYGHKSLDTTLHYIGYQPEEITNEYKKVFGS